VYAVRAAESDHIEGVVLGCKYDVVFFDLEGTLVDPGPGAIEAARYALSRMGIMEASRYRLRRLIGPPLEEAFSLYYNMAPLEAERAADHYSQHYLEYGMAENSLYDGVRRMLALLRQSRTGLVAVSCRDGIYVSRLMRQFALAPSFITARGRSVTGARTSKEQIVGDLLEELPVLEGKNMVLVGDREDDVLAARALGLPCVAAGYGFGSSEELRNAGPDTVVGSVEELSEALLARTAGRL
jgi:phosphoglycolate phosphatase